MGPSSITISLYTKAVMCSDVNLRVAQLTLVVNSQEAALEFYTKKVGFEKKTDFTPPGGHRWVTVGPEGQELELALFELGTPDANGWSSGWKPGIAPPVVLYVDDCHAAFAEMKSRGVPFKQDKPETHPWGTSATFSDPDGNLFSMNELPQQSPRS